MSEVEIAETAGAGIGRKLRSIYGQIKSLEMIMLISLYYKRVINKSKAFINPAACNVWTSGIMWSLVSMLSV